MCHQVTSQSRSEKDRIQDAPAPRTESHLNQLVPDILARDPASIFKKARFQSKTAEEGRSKGKLGG